MLYRRRERALLLFVVTHYVLKPQQLDRFTVFLQLRRQPRTHRLSAACRGRGVERHPRTCFRKVDLDPGVSILLTNRVSTCRVIVLARQEAVDETRGNTAGSQQQ